MRYLALAVALAAEPDGDKVTYGVWVYSKKWSSNIGEGKEDIN